METSTESFNLHNTVEAINKAMQAVVCHMLFDFALHGFIIVIILAVGSYYLSLKKSRYAQAISRVAKRIAIFCVLVAIPGALTLLISHKLPEAGVFSFNSIGLIGFWSLITVHLVAEEINNSIVKPKKDKAMAKDNS